MMVRCCIMYVFAVLINEVSLDVTFTKSVGDPAVLPCLYTADKNKVEKVNWVHDDIVIYEFSPGTIPQKARYNERFESFPEEYENGNYSIKIVELKKTDEGEYTCIITPADHYKSMHLIVNISGNQHEHKEHAQMRSELVIPIVISLFIVVLLGFLFLCCKRKCVFKPR